MSGMDEIVRIVHIYIFLCIPPAGCDYSGLNEVELTFGPAIDSMMYQIPITNDEILEADESFTVSLTVPSTERGVVLGQPSATVVGITDDDSK